MSITNTITQRALLFLQSLPVILSFLILAGPLKAATVGMSIQWPEGGGSGIVLNKAAMTQMEALGSPTLPLEVRIAQPDTTNGFVKRYVTQDQLVSFLEKVSTPDELYGQGFSLRNKNDPYMALRLFELAAQKGSARAGVILGHALVTGKHGVIQDVERGLALLQMAAESETKSGEALGYADLVLSAFYENGIGVPQNHDEAERLLNKAWSVCTTRWCDKEGTRSMVIEEFEAEWPVPK
jgi:hypothetical protein